MRCFSLLLLFSFGFSEEIILNSLTDQKVTIGDIVKFRTETTLSVKELSKYKNKKINELLYVADIKKIASEIILEGFLVDKQKDEKIEVDDSFVIRGLNFEYTKIKLPQQLNIIDHNLELPEFKQSYIYAIIFFITFLSFPWLRKKMRKSKEINQNRKRLSNLLLDVNDKESAEKIFEKRKEFIRYFSYNAKYFDELCEYIKKNQYKKNWSEENTEKTKSLASKLSSTLKDHDGV